MTKELYVKCTYKPGMFSNEKIVTVNACNRKAYCFFTFDHELQIIDSTNALIKVFGICAKEADKAVIMLREEGNPRYFTVPLDDLIERDAQQQNI
ncbi:MAG: hypothetical protein KJ955_02635 [Nanoarchaeota archaeon]|nr:hypothetical protein [Nanoarchaeota archaeon]